jgi:hypothetical protein
MTFAAGPGDRRGHGLMIPPLYKIDVGSHICASTWSDNSKGRNLEIQHSTAINSFLTASFLFHQSESHEPGVSIFMKTTSDLAGRSIMSISSGNPEKSVHDPFLAYSLVALKTSKKLTMLKSFGCCFNFEGARSSAASQADQRELEPSPCHSLEL